MGKRKQTKRTDVEDLRSILRLSYEQGLSVRAISERLKLGKSTISTYLLRAREAGLGRWPLPDSFADDAELARHVFRRMGRPPQDLSVPDWPWVACELKRKSVTLMLLWQEYREVHPNGYGYTWFCDNFAAFEKKISPTYRNRHEAGASMQTDYAGQTVSIIDLISGEIIQAQIFVAVLPASCFTFAYASLSQKLSDWIEGQTRALTFFGGVPKSIVCDNLKAGVVKPLWFEPTINPTFAAMAAHYDTTILPARPKKPKDKAKVEGTVLIVERWILARLRNRKFHSLADLNRAIAELLEDLNSRKMRHAGLSRRQLFDQIERGCLACLPDSPFEYAEWKTAKVHPDYHVEVEKTFYSVPHSLIGQRVHVRLTHRVVEIFHDHKRIASHLRRSQRNGHVTIKDHMPKPHRAYADVTSKSLQERAKKIGPNTALLVERLMRDKRHPQHGYRAAMGILSLARGYGLLRLEAACERALTINAISYASVNSILKSGLDKALPLTEAVKPAPPHANIRGSGYYH